MPLRTDAIDFDEKTSDETVDGTLWHRDDVGELRYRTQSVTYTFANTVDLANTESTAKRFGFFNG